MKIITMIRIKSMIKSAATKSIAISILETWRIFGDITEQQYNKGRELIRKEFD